MIEALLTALILIAILCVVAGAIVKLVPMPHPRVPDVIWLVVAVISLLLLLAVVTGQPVTVDLSIE